MSDENLQEMTEAELIEYYTKQGYELAEHFEKLPFVDWDEVKTLRGVVKNVKEIPSKFVDSSTGERKQKICTVGDYSVNCSAVLKDLDMYNGLEIVIIRSDEKTKSSTSGNDYWSFHVIPITGKKTEK